MVDASYHHVDSDDHFQNIYIKYICILTSTILKCAGFAYFVSMVFKSNLCTSLSIIIEKVVCQGYEI